MYECVQWLPVYKQSVVIRLTYDVKVIIISHHPNEVDVYAGQIVKSYLENFELKLTELKYFLQNDGNRGLFKFVSVHILLALSHHLNTYLPSKLSSFFLSALNILQSRR